MATLPGLVTALEESAARARDLTAPLETVGSSLLRAAAPRAPRASGLLAGSVRARASAGLLELVSPVRYFAPVHNGRRRRGNVKARPWLAETITASETQTGTTLTTHLLAPLERL